MRAKDFHPHHSRTSTSGSSGSRQLVNGSYSAALLTRQLVNGSYSAILEEAAAEKMSDEDPHPFLVLTDRIGFRPELTRAWFSHIDSDILQECSGPALVRDFLDSRFEIVGATAEDRFYFRGFSPIRAIQLAALVDEEDTEERLAYRALLWFGAAPLDADTRAFVVGLRDTPGAGLVMAITCRRSALTRDTPPRLSITAHRSRARRES